MMSWMDMIWMLGYMAVVLALGIYGGRRERSSEDYFVGGRNVPWLAVLGSLIATEVSAATFLAVPGVGFSENMTYLQFGLGSIVARIFVATFFLKFFFENRCSSIYEFFQKRYGNRSQYTASLYFIVTRLLASSVRLMIAVTGLSVILGVPFLSCLIIFALITLIYTGLGGIKAVIWTDCLQAVLFLSAGVAVFCFLIYQLGWSEFIALGVESERFDMIRLMPSSTSDWKQWLNDPQWLVTAFLFGALSTLGAMGTDQDMVQRLLCSRDVGKAKRSLVLSGFIAIPIAGLFLMVGVALFGYFQSFPDAGVPMMDSVNGQVVDSNRIFPYFITTEIPFWLRGLLLMGLVAAAMSSLDSAMAALSSSAVVDLIQPMTKRNLDHSQVVFISRLTTAVFAVLLVVLAVLMNGGETFLWLAFKVTSLTYSGLLGLFFLGMFTKRGSDVGNVIAMVSGTGIAAVYLWSTETGLIPLAWTWVIVLGAIVSFGVGYSFNEKARS